MGIFTSNNEAIFFWELVTDHIVKVVGKQMVQWKLL